MDSQAAFNYPAQLTDKYRPKTLGEFVGLEKPRRIFSTFLQRPKPSAWLFVGPPGVGKTSMALAIADALGSCEPWDLHKIPSQKCNVQAIDDVTGKCHYMPHKSGGFHVVIADEADGMTPSAQLALLSKLDSSDPAPNTIWIFTANTTDGLEPKFLSRCHVIEFSSYGLREELAKHLARVWELEGGTAENAPDFARMAKDSTNNVRDALNCLDVELLGR